MATNYIVMKNHKRLWHWLLMREDMESEKKFWIMLLLQTINVSFMFRCVFFVEGIEGKIEISGPALCWFGGMFCYSMAFPNHKIIFDVVSRLQEHYESLKAVPEDRDMILECYKEGDRIMTIFASIISSCGVCFMFKPIISFVFEYFSDGDAELLLPFPAVYPWEPKGILFFICLAMQLSLLPWVLPMVVLNVSTSVFYCMAIVSQLKLTQMRFRDISEDCNADEGMTLLKVALKSHQDALELIKSVESAERAKYFSLVFSTAAALSMCMFRLSCASIKDLEVIVPFTVLATSIVLQLGLICFYGQRVIDEGDKLYEEIYATPWYSQPRPFKSCVLFCLMRSARTDRLTAIIADISFETFNMVMTSAFSYITFLQTMSE